MRSALDLYESYELASERESEMGFKEFLDYFSRTSHHVYDKYLPDRFNSYTEAYYYLKNIIYTLGMKSIPEFYYYLNEFGFNKNMEIIDAIKMLTQASDLRETKEICDYLVKSPLINDILFDGDLIKLETTYGEYRFTKLVDYFKSNPKALNYVKKYNLINLCHQASWELLSHVEKVDLVTSLIPVYFGGNCYHTYLQESNNGNIIDPAHGAMFDIATYERLFQPEVVSRTPKEETNNQYNESISSGDFSGTDYSEPLVIALRKQMV